jgi:hypothetical protein
MGFGFFELGERNALGREIRSGDLGALSHGSNAIAKARARAKVRGNAPYFAMQTPKVAPSHV